VAAALLLTGTAGCSTIGNVLIPAHPDSLQPTMGVPKLKLTEVACSTVKELVREPEENAAAAAAPALGGMAIGALADLAADRIAAAVEAEAGRYRATYSARRSELVEPGRCLEVEFTRNTNAGKALTFTAYLGVRENGAVGQIVDPKLAVKQTKAKVAHWKTLHSLWPWRWPGALAIAVYGLIDEDIYKVDISASVTIEAIGMVGKGVSATTVGPYPFPAGKLHIDELGERKPTESVYFPLPIITYKEEMLPLNVTVSIEEGNDLGDPVKRAAEKLAANRDDIAARIRGAFGQ
jgi:hypothetical protein